MGGVDSALELFAKNLRRHRKGKGLSQERLALECDLHRTSISDYECAKTSPRLETIVSLTHGLDLESPCELLEGIG